MDYILKPKGVLCVMMKKTILLIAVFHISSALLYATAFAAQPDTLKVFDVTDGPEGYPPGEWVNERPDDQLLYTDYTVLRSIDGYYLRARTNGTGSWLEYTFDEGLDITRYPVMTWRWKTDRLPEVEWEKNEEENDFALRIELVYDLPGNKWNPLNMARKGLVRALFKGNPPELITSYVWAANVPAEKPYASPESEKTMIIPVQSTRYMTGRWLIESRNVAEDYEHFRSIHKLVLKKIRIRADTDNSMSISESGLMYIYLVGGKE